MVIGARVVGAPLRDADLRVAAALSRRPFGLRSARAVGRLAGVPPTSAARSLHRLARRGIVRRRLDPVSAGKAGDVAVWTIDWCSASWHEVATEVGLVRRGTPARPAEPAPRVPARLAHLFWNADLRGVDPAAHGHYVASRILRADDCQALGWLARHLDPDAIRRAAAGRGLEPRRRALAHLLAGSPA
jgi:hypothetical protein